MELKLSWLDEVRRVQEAVCVEHLSAIKKTKQSLKLQSLFSRLWLADSSAGVDSLRCSLIGWYQAEQWQLLIGSCDGCCCLCGYLLCVCGAQTALRSVSARPLSQHRLWLCGDSTAPPAAPSAPAQTHRQEASELSLLHCSLGLNLPPLCCCVQWWEVLTYFTEVRVVIPQSTDTMMPAF